MTEDEARAWLAAQHVSRETVDSITAFVDFLFQEGESQNLISASSRAHVWARHIVDSAQLAFIAQAQEAPDGPWLDLGSGAGFPGLIIAALMHRPVILVESRRKRADFLIAAADILGVSDHVKVDGRRLELIETQKVGVISARAFAPLERLFPLAERFSRSETLWLLPKGRSAQSELADARKTWQGAFHVEQSVTDPEAAIIVARGVRRGKK
ncbi:16S rRNA (guanine(527)-N(7))-methyltransferase RsmG [Sphingobium boeckii]|uniref:16S rRNA (guanine(527)-N(7))-methyltransferase RsmG n=1 Tax=Sphingobium boeckii TaxID=1082345 RepID=UPI0016125AD7|nr:RsmG family class I SAM-dependent methyltransferase [Sphingobium boeckii]